jgi:uncharacterized protein (DUF433 family)
MRTVMATALAKTVFPHITTDPEVCHGRPCIAGTRIRVMDIVAAHEQGASVDDLRNHFDTRALTLGEIHAALAYYNDHKESVENTFAEDMRSTAEGMASEVERPQRPTSE